MGNDVLEKKIDANTNKNLEQQEVLNFIKSEKNVQELGNYLSKTVGGWSDNLVRVSSDVITKNIGNIDKKVRGNQLLSVEEKALMKLKYAMEKKEYPLNDAVLNMYLGTNFGNFGYKPNTESIIVVKKTLEKKVESQSLPFLEYKKGYETASINNLLEWAKNNNPTGYETERKKSEIRNDNKDDQYKDDYIKYDLALYSFDLYSKLVTKKDREIQKKAGYSTEEDFTKQGELIASLSQALDIYKKEKFPTIDVTFDKFKKYNDDINKTAKKAGYTTPEKQKESAAFYTVFQKDSMKLVEQYNIQDIVAKIKNPQLSSGTHIEEYFGNVNKMLEYTQAYEQLQQKTGLNTLKKYEGYLSQIDIIIKKYGVDSIKEWGSDIEKYVAGVTELKNTYHGSTIDRKKYEYYQKLAQNSAIGRYTEGRYGLYQLLNDPANKNSSFRGLKKEAQENAKSQDRVDSIWQTIKNINPIAYQVLNFGASAWNGVVDFTVGTGSSLGLMLQSTYKDDDERKASADFKQSFDSFLKFNLSRSQSKPPLDEQGNWNLGLDNTVSQVGSQLANMVALLSGSGAIGRGVTKLGVGAVISQRIGLVSMAFMQQAGRSFEEGKTQGLDDGQALSYSMLQSSIGAGLELISPNQMMMGTGNKVVKEYIKNIIKTETKQSILQVGKVFTKNIVGEVLEENIQETMQLAVGNGINMWANDRWGTKFDANWRMDNFATTALLTTLTTGLGTSKQALSMGVASTQVLSPLQKQDLKKMIISDTVLYGQTTKVLNDIMSGKIQLQGVDTAVLQELQSELKQMEGVKNNLVVENKNDSDGVGVQKNPGNIETSNKNQINILQDIQTANSRNSDKIINVDGSINPDAKIHLESFLRTKKVLSEKATLTDEQVKKIYEVHTMNRNPGEIDDVQLNIRKGRALRTIFDETITRTLMEGKVCGEIENDISLIQGNVDTAIGQIKDFNGYINDTFVYQSLEESFHNFGHIKNTIDNLHANIDENINKLLELHKDQPAIYEEIVLLKNSLTNRFNEILPIIYNLQSLLTQNYEIMSQNGMRENLQQSIIAQQGKLYAYAQSLSHEISLLQTSLSNNINEINKRIFLHQSTENDSKKDELPQLDISTIITHYPDLLKNIINPEVLSQIIQTEIRAGNLVLNPDGSIKEVFVEVDDKKKSSQLFSKMKADGFSEQQALKTWLQIRTPQFKNRFGDWQSMDKSQVSKIVDENGEPLITYRILEQETNKFDNSVHYKGLGKGIYFGFDSQSKYMNRFGKYIYPTFLNVENLEYEAFLEGSESFLYGQDFNFSKERYKLSMDRKIKYHNNIINDSSIPDAKKESNKITLSKLIDKRDNIERYYNDINTYDGRTTRNIGKINIRHDGDESIDQIIIKDPTNAKSAINNDGSFSPETARFNN